MITGLTINDVEEAIGIAPAARPKALCNFVHGRNGWKIAFRGGR